MSDAVCGQRERFIMYMSGGLCVCLAHTSRLLGSDTRALGADACARAAAPPPPDGAVATAGGSAGRSDMAAAGPVACTGACGTRTSLRSLKSSCFTCIANHEKYASASACSAGCIARARAVGSPSTPTPPRPRPSLVTQYDNSPWRCCTSRHRRQTQRWQTL